MGNTPCAHAVDSVLHRRVEIKVNKRQTVESKMRNTIESF